MEDYISLGFPFEARALWPQSLLLHAPAAESIFEALQTDGEALEPLHQDHIGHWDLHTAWPERGRPTDARGPASGATETLPASHEACPDSSASDAGDFDIDHGGDAPARPHFHTWEAFERTGGSDAAGRTAFLSEAGPEAFDAALQSVEKGMGVLPQDFTLRAMCSLALGRSSRLFHWSLEHNAFCRTLAGARMAGTSLLCSESMVENLLHLGNMTVRLRACAESPRTSHGCPAAMALRSCIATVVDAVEQRISSAVGTVRSCLQLQQLVATPSHLLQILSRAHAQTETATTDASLISALSDLVHGYAESESRFCTVLQTLLARVSMPWLESLSVDLGLHVDPIGRREESASEDVAGSEDQRHSAHLNTNDENLVRVTKQAVAVLRAQCPKHPLLQHNQSSTSKSFLKQSTDRREVERAAKQYETYMTKLMLHGEPVEQEGKDAAVPASTSSSEDTVWTDPTQLSYLADSGDLMSLEPGLASPDKLHELAAAALVALPQNSALEFSLEDQGFSPIEHIRPFVRTQHKLVNGVLLRQLMRHHNLRQKLEQQRAFQLLGNGNFAARLSKALFDKDVQSAERKRGVVPTADDMGLRVGATKDQRWPPASSELQLSLMGLLTDATGGGEAAAIAATTPCSHLSFAIRELPEEEIERVLDPHSIYALDFLRIQYTTHAPINAVITPASLQQYDGMFKYLLKLLRLLHITADLPRTIPGSRVERTHRDTLAFAQRAREFVTVLTGHVMSVGIAPPWQDFSTALRILEHNLHTEDEQSMFASKVTMDIEGLRQLHERCLDRIRTRLFLKKKHEKLRNAVEDVLTSILKCATALQTEATDIVNAEHHATFDQTLRQLIKQLAEIAAKPPRTVSAADAEDLDVMRILLAKLDWNGYYAGGVLKAA